jgi:hypothetical protein
MSHWLGAHSFKVGYEGLFAADDRTFRSNNQNVTYGFFGAETSQITMVISPFTTLARVAQTSAYAQDQWTLGRVTLQGALRYDRVRSWFPEQRIENFPERLTGPTQFLPSVLVLPETRGVDAYNDVTPRVGVAYDIFGNSKTAVKFSAGKYLEGAGTSGIYYDTNPATRIQRSVSRSWGDSNHDYVPNCDLARAEPNGECGFFGSSFLLGQVLPLSYDPDLLRGPNVRPSDWSIGASIEHQVLWGASVEVGYSRRSFAGFTVTDNIVQPPASFGSTVTAPTNPILPNGGGQRIGPLYRLLVFPPPQRVVTASRKYGNQHQYSDSFDVVFNWATIHYRERARAGDGIRQTNRSARSPGCEGTHVRPDARLHRDRCVQRAQLVGRADLFEFVFVHGLGRADLVTHIDHSASSAALQRRREFLSIPVRDRLKPDPTYSRAGIENDQLDVELVASWIRQASELPGLGPVAAPSNLDFCAQCAHT